VNSVVAVRVFQRLCEELEYSELVDQAAEAADPIQRMVSMPLGCCLIYIFDCITLLKRIKSLCGYFMPQQLPITYTVQVFYDRRVEFIYSLLCAGVNCCFCNKSIRNIQLSSGNETFQSVDE
jgi:hypothetical protein